MAEVLDLDQGDLGSDPARNLTGWPCATCSLWA